MKKAQKPKDVTLHHSGTQILLPALPTPMSIKDGIMWLQRLDEQQQKVVDIIEVIEGFISLLSCLLTVWALVPLKHGTAASIAAQEVRLGWFLGYLATPAFEHTGVVRS